MQSGGDAALVKLPPPLTSVQTATATLGLSATIIAAAEALVRRCRKRRWSSFMLFPQYSGRCDGSAATIYNQPPQRTHAGALPKHGLPSHEASLRRSAIMAVGAAFQQLKTGS